jgi:hypothetical protein
MESLNGLLNWAGELLVAGRFHLTHTIAAFRRSEARGKAKAEATSAQGQCSVSATALPCEGGGLGGHR